jgi:hypothetical protein
LALEGSFRVLYLYDVAEEIRLEELRSLLGSEGARRAASFHRPAPDYVRFANPPVVEPLDPFLLPEGRAVRGQVNYYEYGVISLQMDLPFLAGWEELVALSSRWMAEPEFESQAAARLARLLDKCRPAMVKPYESRLSEDYYLVHLLPQEGVTAAQLLQEHGADIARIIRGELAPLSSEEQAEVLQARLSYSPNDLLVAAWSAAFVYDTDEGAVPTVQLLEYANTQLLEFRHYDELLTSRLAEFYREVERGTGMLRRWKLARDAERLNAMRLEVRELTERADTAIKFLSDMFSARLYRLAAARVGVPDYRRLVEDKLRTAGELCQFMSDRVHQSSALILESMVVVILIIDLFYLFRGKS